MRGAVVPLPQYAFLAWCSFKSQEQLYLLPYYVILVDSYTINFQMVSNFQKTFMTQHISILYEMKLL